MRDLAWGSSEEIAAFKATLYIKSCSRSAGVCERAAQHSSSICCAVKRTGTESSDIYHEECVRSFCDKGDTISCTVTGGEDTR